MAYVALQPDQDVITNGQTETIGVVHGLGSTVDRLVGLFIIDQPGNLTIEQSVDGTNWDFVETIAVVANTGVRVSTELVAPYARIRFANTGAAPSTFSRGAFRTSSAGPR